MFHAAPVPAKPQISASSEIATAGYFNLDWDGTAPFRLERSQAADFHNPILLYSGKHHSSVISGLADGEYFFRVSDATSTSNPVKVEVVHHSLGRAFSFFFLGALIFLATLIVLFRGNRN